MREQTKIIYRMIETTEYVMDSGIVTTYGVSCSSGGAGDGRDQACDQIIPNISTRPSFVEELVDRLNIHNAAPVHLKDLIDDFLP